MSEYRDVSLWMDQVEDDLAPRTALSGDLQCDVAIVGGGYTGLWTAYYLRRADPGLRIVVLEKDICGFGASGRNGGWCSALFAASKTKIAKRYGRDAAIAMQRAMFATVDEVGRVAQAEGIDCNFHKGGTLVFATNPAHVDRLREEATDEHRWGLSEEDIRWLEPREAAGRLNVAGSLGASFTPHCARVHPARLARGLARVVESSGVSVFESTAVQRIEPGKVVTSAGTVSADVVVRATEAYTARLGGQRRVLLPLYSLMIATEPLPASFWDEAGWEDRETMSDGRHLLIYAQRTPDDRIAFGGRGAPYHFGSRIEPGFDRKPDVFAELEKVLIELWPQLRGTAITHRWGGPLGAPRDWFSSVGFERATGMAWAGGYVGDGVSTTNLAGRTLADLITGEVTETTRLPWVGHRSRRWEPEPLRWAGTNLALAAMASADRAESRSGRSSARARLIGRVVGL